MKKSPAPTWWSRLRAQRQTETPRELDPAEMGTAFGLDMSFAALDRQASGSPSDARDSNPFTDRLNGRSTH